VTAIGLELCEANVQEIFGSSIATSSVIDLQH